MTGISAGGAFLVQYQLAYSSTVQAAGIVAGIPYNCAQDNVLTALDCMSSPELTDLDTLIQNAQTNAAAGLLDPLKNLQRHNVWLWSGIADTVVVQGTMILVDRMFRRLGVGQITPLFNFSAEHSWVTDSWGNSCSHLGNPYINNCNYDFGGNFLASAFSSMGLQWNSTRGVFNPNNMFQFDLGAFGASTSANSLDTTAYIYIPTACQGSNTSNASSSTTCHLHVNFHGCLQYRTHFSNHREYVDHTGLNDWAEANNIVIFYPQTVATSFPLYNPKGCFDWWGYAGSLYATNQGAQMSIIRAAVKSLLSE
jgi:hypothetical protein